MVETPDYAFDPSAHVENCSCECEPEPGDPAGTAIEWGDYYDQQLNGGGASDEEEEHQGDWVGQFTVGGGGVVRNGITAPTSAVATHDSSNPDATPADWDEFFADQKRQQVLEAFEFLYGEDGLKMLKYYEEAGNSWHLQDYSWWYKLFWDSDLEWVGADSEITINDELDPFSAAQELMKRLLEGWGDTDIRARIVSDYNSNNGKGDQSELFELLPLTNTQGLAAGAEITALLAEAYVGGILEWTPQGTIVLVFSYASDGQYGNAALTAIPLPLHAIPEGQLDAVIAAAKSGTRNSVDEVAHVLRVVDDAVPATSLDSCKHLFRMPKSPAAILKIEQKLEEMRNAFTDAGGKFVKVNEAPKDASGNRIYGRYIQWEAADGSIKHRIELYIGHNTTTRFHELLHFEQAAQHTGLMSQAHESIFEADVLWKMLMEWDFVLK